MKPYPPAYYSDYLHLEKLLTTQLPRSTEFGKSAHDEMLFITVHQVYEIWFKQILHELDSVAEMFREEFIDDKNIGIAVSRLVRITEIQKVMIDQFRILETMTPLDFLDFRDFLSPASGFQSFQFRLIEIKLGLHSKQRLNYNQASFHSRLSSEHQALVKQVESEPTLFELIEKWLERTPFLKFEAFDFWQSYRKAVNEMLDQDSQIISDNPTLTDAQKQKELDALKKTELDFEIMFDESKHNELIKSNERHLSYKAAKAALLILLYRDQPVLHLPFKLITALVDIDELFTTWRYKHSLLVHRMIGTKIGTGGSSGHDYLKKTIDAHQVFSDFFNLSTFLIPRSSLPELPKEVIRELGFYYKK